VPKWTIALVYELPGRQARQPADEGLGAEVLQGDELLEVREDLLPAVSLAGRRAVAGF
jgi:hypothetical protein